MEIALVNTNRIKPPIAPIGLEYVAESLAAAGFMPYILDLCWEEDWRGAAARFFDSMEFPLIGATLRNTDDCSFTSRVSFLPDFSEIVSEIRRRSKGVIVAGGVGFSTMPETSLESSGADAGIWGEGEFVMPMLAREISSGREWRNLPNLIYKKDGAFHRNPPIMPSLDALPTMRRRWFDNRRYFKEGGQAGFETKRGCSRACIYCADPLAKGKNIRVRPAKDVVDEIENLLIQGIDHLHTCDAEFNYPELHAIEICQEILRRQMGDSLRWYAYCTAVPFSRELARLMRRAGCVGINFGVDSGDAEMLKSLGRDFTPDDIISAVRACRDAGITTMMDLLLGAPGESRESLKRTIDLMKFSGADAVGVTVGVRIYPGTKIHQWASNNGQRSCPDFYIEPNVEQIIFPLLDELIGGDERFLFHDPSKAEKNYNYNANDVLVNAIRAGHRGAYWDILRRCR
ncbi:MAG TPA: radical SAM protein [Candidatus Sumerlaeota bacterium]|nr:MAG: (Dimethylallyl)adenosine tRNA methylthiotransferase MiaB [candidate division BRC1 bacterium ADurb.Bin183]HOE63923.1 radical SAM protein [Candidatus Sumerlaeota bacterium]HRR32179.1 radical SAM protein [Candidatus Sumerlaeia bacterium]HON51209.1 radical SAM protein [Candidatus Sumerlaeota bacterium]HOR64474.1 radical SAM protein [Candidatus Sumerlaeota bacterium]